VTEHIFPCPCCGFEVFSEPSGSYGICPLCGWEDDHVQLRFPAVAGGANKCSLAQSQVNALLKFPLTMSEAAGHRRALGWRPLLDDECLPHGDEPASGIEYFIAAGGKPPPYYWES
jgi:hypothetical protein